MIRFKNPPAGTNTATTGVVRYLFDGTNTRREGVNGDGIMQTYVSAKGEPSTFGPKEESRPFDPGAVPANPFLPPGWNIARAIGTDVILGLPAAIIECPALGHQYWVVDHPLAGTLSLKRVESGDDQQVIEVLKFDLRSR